MEQTSTETWAGRAFSRAIDNQFYDRAQTWRKRLNLDLLRDGSGLPTVEAEMGWRTIFMKGTARD